MTERRTSLVSLALIVVVVASAAVAVGTTTPALQDDRDAIPPEQGSAHGVDGVMFWKLWSNDQDPADGSEEDIDHENIEDPEAAKKVSKGADFVFGRPPDAVQQWNSGDIGDFSPGGDNTAKVVGGASTQSATGSGVDIYDAYVEVFSIGPSTVVHLPGREERYVTGDPTLRAISDFRYEKESSESFGSSDDIEKWKNPNTEATVEVKKDGSVVDSWTTSGSVGSLSHEYSVSDTADLNVEVTYEVTVNHEKYDCTDWNSSTDSCDGHYDKEHDHDHTRTVTVSDGDTVTKQDEPKVEITKYEYKNSERGVLVVEPEGLWRTINLGEVTIRNQWEFYTRSPEGWETMVTKNQNGATENPSDVRPAVVHAYPVYPEARVTESPSGLRVSNLSSSISAGPISLGSDINVQAPADRKEVDKVVLQSDQLDQHSISPENATGLTSGVSNDSLSIGNTNDVRKTTVKILSKTNTKNGTRYEVTVVDGSGTPVTEGNLSVGGDSHSLGGGPIQVTLTSGIFGGAQLRYEPPGGTWSTGDQDRYQTAVHHVFPDASTDVPGAFEMLQLAVYTLIWFVPLGLAGLALDYMLGIRLFRDALPSVHDTFRGIRDAIFER